MKSVWKYTINLRDNNGTAEFSIPEGSRIAAVGPDPQHPNGPEFVSLWAIVDTNAPQVTRTFIVKGTGHPIDELARDELVYVGTVVTPPFDWHVFELVEKD